MSLQLGAVSAVLAWSLDVTPPPPPPPWLCRPTVGVTKITPRTTRGPRASSVGRRRAAPESRRSTDTISSPPEGQRCQDRRRPRTEEAARGHTAGAIAGDREVDEVVTTVVICLVEF